MISLELGQALTELNLIFVRMAGGSHGGKFPKEGGTGWVGRGVEGIGRGSDHGQELSTERGLPLALETEGQPRVQILP